MMLKLKVKVDEDVEAKRSGGTVFLYIEDTEARMNGSLIQTFPVPERDEVLQADPCG